ncbi:glucosyltransferase domain-containing protein [bacterium 210820-DFI.6.38]|nr:glucosyltransferase domain-containing protein [bacterium 210820-DFI.6.38]
MNCKGEIKAERVTKFLLLYLCIGISFFTYGMFLNAHYSVDSYSVYFSGDPQIHLMNTRYINYFCMKLFDALHFNTVSSQSCGTFMLILTIAYIIYEITKQLYQAASARINILCGEFLIAICVGLSFCNVFMLEWFLYPEITIFYSLSLLFCLGAIKIWCLNQRIPNAVSATVLLLCSLLCYQAAFAYFGFFCILYMLINEDLKYTKILFKRIVCTFCIIFLSCSAMLILQKIFTREIEARTANLSFYTVIQNIKQIIQLQLQLLYDGNGFFIQFILGVGLIVLSLCLCQVVGKFTNNPINIFLLILGCIGICYSMVFTPHLFTSTLWFAPRTMVGFWTVFSMISIIIIVISTSWSYRIITLITMMILLVCNVFLIHSIGVNHFITNYLDREYSEEIEKNIKKYEAESNTSISKIATVFDASPSYSYPGIKYVKYDTNTKAFSVDWGDVNTINFYNQTNYKKVPFVNSMLEFNPHDYNWNDFVPDEQLIFKGDTLVIIKY